MTAAQIDGVGREVHTDARRKRQHPRWSSATSLATYATSVPTSTRTSTSDTPMTMLLGAIEPTMPVLGARSTARRRGAWRAGGGTLLRSVHRHHRSVAGAMRWLRQNRSTDC